MRYTLKYEHFDRVCFANVKETENSIILGDWNAIVREMEEEGEL